MTNDILKAFSYEGNDVTFYDKSGTLYVNATEMAKSFGNGKRPQFWLNLQSTKDFLEALTEARNLALADLQVVTKGGNNAGTWLHKDAAMEFARWLSPKFAIWCNDRIEELLTKGHTEVAQSYDIPQSYSDALLLAAKQAKELEESKAVVASQARQIAELEVKTSYCDIILKSSCTIPITVIAQDYGMSAQKMNALLHDMNIQYHSGESWIVYSKYKAEGYVQSETIQISPKRVRTYTKWTQKGRLFLYDTLKRSGIVPMIERNLN